MKVWRLCRQPFAATALEGIGGLHASGRWHRRGRPIVYAASSAALAALEVLVHVDPLDAPDDLRLLTIELPAAGTGSSSSETIASLELSSMSIVELPDDEAEASPKTIAAVLSALKGGS